MIAIAVMARHPHVSDVKTRLAPKLGPAERSALYQAFLRDKLEQLSAVRHIARVVAYTPREHEAWFRAFAPIDFELYPQADGSLGERVIAAFTALLVRFPCGVILTDSDSPTLPPTYLEQAARALDHGREVVIGPSDDGGYYLIGLTRLIPGLFDRIAWSTERVCEQTLVAARARALTPELLPPWYDVDRPEDLERLATDLRTNRGYAAPRTRAVLAIATQQVATE